MNLKVLSGLATFWPALVLLFHLDIICFWIRLIAQADQKHSHAQAKQNKAWEIYVEERQK